MILHLGTSFVDLRRCCVEATFIKSSYALVRLDDRRIAVLRGSSVRV
jgi:hypothetical protein